VLFWELLHEEEPWKKVKDIDELRIKLVDNNEILKISGSLPDSMKTLLPTFWVKKRNRRPDITAIFNALNNVKDELNWIRSKDPNVFVPDDV